MAQTLLLLVKTEPKQAHWIHGVMDEVIVQKSKAIVALWHLSMPMVEKERKTLLTPNQNEVC